MSVRTQTNNYLRQVTAISKACGVYRKPMVEGLRADLEDYLDEYPEATEELLNQHFGRPEEYVKEFLTGVSSEELARNLSAKRFRRKLAIAVAAVILTAFVGLCLWVGIVNNQTVGRFYSRKVVDTSVAIPLGKETYG